MNLQAYPLPGNETLDSAHQFPVASLRTKITQAIVRLVWGCELFVLLVGAGVVAGEANVGKAVGRPTTEEPNAPSLDLDAIVKYLEELYRSESSMSRTRLTVTKPRRTRELEMTVRTRGDERALIVIEAPVREKGTATLKVGKNLWNYLPRIKRTIRIPPSMMLSPWMGSDFTNDDLVQESSLRHDYTYQLAGHSTAPKGWIIRFQAKPDIVGLWNRIDFVVTMDPILPVQATYYDRKDRLSRTMYWDEVRDFDGKMLPAHMTLIPEDKKKKGHKTEMRYLEIKFNTNIPESTFSLSRLERKR